MRYRFLFLFLLPVGSAFAQTTIAAEEDSAVAAVQQKLTPHIGKPFPDFSASLKDSVITKESLKGKTVFISFWFEPALSVAEFDGLNKVYAKTKDNDGLRFLTFTYEKPETVKAVRTKYGIAFPVLSVAPEECRRLLQRSGYPTSMIVDKRGKIVYAYCGGTVDNRKASEWVMKEYYPRLMKLLND